MKIIAFLLLFVPVHVLAQNTDAVPAITAIGKPDGEKTEMKIGKEGGSFTSSDGRIRLLVPEGAVSKKTNFSIQPTTNLMPNGNGRAYKMEPSGINFQKKLQVIFYYTDNETQGNPPDLLGIAMQDDKGRWSIVNRAVTDTATRTITADIRHFSTYVNFLWAKIEPASARVKINGSIRLKITAILPGTDDDELSSLGIEIINAPAWSVCGIPNGNSVTGLISVSQDYTAIYQAPAQVPEQNPVAVSVDFTGASAGILEKKFKNLKLVSNITIYGEAYEVKMEMAIIGGSPMAWGGITTARDEGSFIVSLEKNKPAVINIKNQFEVVTDNCQKIILNPASNTGIFHVAGVRQIKVTPANLPGQPYPIVEISFTPYPIELSRTKYICPPPPGVRGQSIATVDMSQMAYLVFFGQPALPQYIKFIANDREQILLENPAGAPGLYYKMWVKKIIE
jgi:hypothetical protein